MQQIPPAVLLDSTAYKTDIQDTVQKFTLNPKQTLCVRIVLEHFHKTLLGSKPAQLLMAIIGEPGVGKSVVIQAITHHIRVSV